MGISDAIFYIRHKDYKDSAQRVRALVELSDLEIIVLVLMQ